MIELHRWVWDLLADLVEQEDVHPKLFFTSGAFEGYRPYDWCPQAALAKVPAEVLAAARVVARYRRTERRSDDLADWEAELLARQCTRPEPPS